MKWTRLTDPTMITSTSAGGADESLALTIALFVCCVWGLFGSMYTLSNMI